MKFTPGPAIASASGSLGGTTFSHNRFGAYTRKRAIPTDPNTDRQQAVKTNFSYLSTYWNVELTESERQTWTDYGANVPRIDSLGQTHYLTGLQWFIGFNTLRMQFGLPVQSTGPTTYNRGQIPALTNIASFDEAPISPVTGSYLNLNDGNATINLQFAEALTGAASIMIYLGRPQNPTINFYRAPWRFWGGTVAAGTQISLSETGTPPNVIGPIPFVFTVGQVAFVRLRILNSDGRYSPAVDFRLPVWDVFE